MSSRIGILDLQGELQELVKGVPSFTDSGYSVFDVDDLRALSGMQAFPIAGVAYDGAIPNQQVGNDARATAANAGSAKNITYQFTIIIGVQYHYAGDTDTKEQAFALLTDVLRKVQGYKGVNTRPWVFVGERPEPDASQDGLVYYSQVWQTIVPTVGDFNNT